MHKTITTLITDLDNTLYDWVAMWGASFPAMLRVLVEKSGIPQEVIEQQARVIHQQHGTSEYSFLIESLPCLQQKHPGGNLVEIYKDAVEAYKRGRDAALVLYPTVLSTLTSLRTKGVFIVGYTDSRAFYSKRRVKALKLDGVLDVLYSPADHALPDGKTLEMLRSQPPAAYELAVTRHNPTPEGETKPNPDLLLDIIREIGGTPESAIYVGDSPMKDIVMAQLAHVEDVYAAYGHAQKRLEYAILQRVSHWPESDVKREGEVKIDATHTLHKEFAELLDMFDFQPFTPAADR
jgi:FMN phosphatase YigB (HAD superfamily)